MPLAAREQLGLSSMIEDMKRALFCSVVALLFGCMTEAQDLDQDIVRPGEYADSEGAGSWLGLA
jgi:hypothetical protein